MKRPASFSLLGKREAPVVRSSQFSVIKKRVKPFQNESNEGAPYFVLFFRYPCWAALAIFPPVIRESKAMAVSTAAETFFELKRPVIPVGNKN